jgi:Bifunctional DNA primase/polymerase, N-terminal
MIDSALQWIADGFSICPLHVRGKRPQGRLAPNGFKSATLDPDVVRDWWTESPNANIGIATGAGFFVIDLDNDEAIADFDELAQRHGGMPPTFTVATGRGQHLYFKTEAAVPCTTSKIGAGIDVRGVGGGIVAPPSIHQSGKRYRIIRDDPLVDPPAWLMAIISPPRLAVPKWKPSTHPRTAFALSRYGEAALDNAANAITSAPQGAQELTLNGAAFSIGQLVAGGEIPMPIAEDALRVAAAYMPAYGRPWDARRLNAKIHAAMTAGMREPRRRPR